MRFAGTGDAVEAAAPSIWSQFTKADAVRLAEAGILGIAVILCLLLVLRPLMLRLSVVAGQPAAALSGPKARAAIASGETFAEEDPNAMVQIANVDGELRAASIQSVASLVDRHPDATLALVRGWLAPEPGE